VAAESTLSVGQLAERYLRAIAALDWPTVIACLSPDIVRHGPFGDDYVGVGPYLEFLERTMPTLPGYEMEIDRVSVLSDRRVMVELRETVEIDKAPLVTHECLVMDADDDGLLAEVSIYIRQSKSS
jgi:hypothetical protein